MIKKGLLDEARDAALFAEVDGEVKAAIAAVETAAAPERESIFDDVYSKAPWHLEEQKREMLRNPPPQAHGGGGH
jgi:TPP-dependent pyruvate/acetoin dehydrogenase alpha subunit